MVIKIRNDNRQGLKIGTFTDFVYSVLFLLFLYVFGIPFLLQSHKSVNVPNGGNSIDLSVFDIKY